MVQKVVSFRNIVKTSIDEERFNSLKALNQERNLNFTDEKIRKIMNIEQQTLLPLLALQYRNNFFKEGSPVFKKDNT